MKQVAVAAVLLLAGCTHAPDHRHAGPGAVDENLMREGTRTTLSSTKNSFQAAGCYVLAVQNRSDGLTATSGRIDAEDRWRVTVRTRGGQVAAIVNVVPAGSGSSAELFARPGSVGSVEGFRRFLAERC
jgi:hypothetical protein